MQITKRFVGIIVGMICTSVGLANEIIYKDTFSGPAGSLSGKPPEESAVSRAKWIARPEMVTDGNVVTPNTLPGKCAVLPFRPQNGRIYRVSVDLDISGGRFVALGFLSNNSTPMGNELFWDLIDTPSPWMTLASTGNINTFSGPQTNGYLQFLNQGTSGQLAIELNTTQTDWVATYYFNGNELRKEVFSGALQISYVGFGVEPISDVSVDNFVLEVVSD